MDDERLDGMSRAAERAVVCRSRRLTPPLARQRAADCQVAGGGATRRRLGRAAPPRRCIVEEGRREAPREPRPAPRRAAGERG